MRRRALAKAVIFRRRYARWYAGIKFSLLLTSISCCGRVRAKPFLTGSVADQSQSISFVPYRSAPARNIMLLPLLKSPSQRLEDPVRIFVIAWLLAVPPVASAQELGWHRHAVPETGAQVDLPATIFRKDGGQPDQGYGRRFMTSDGRATFTVQSLPNTGHDSPAALLAKKNPPSDITYKRITNRFFVVPASGKI